MPDNDNLTPIGKRKLTGAELRQAQQDLMERADKITPTMDRLKDEVAKFEAEAERLRLDEEAIAVTIMAMEERSVWLAAGGWRCEHCDHRNPATTAKCEHCETVRG